MAAAELAEAGCPSPRVDAEWLLAEALSVSRSELQADGPRELSPEIAAGFRLAIARRAAREPLAYILGEWGFRRLELRVDSRVLIPRPETEVLVERSRTPGRNRQAARARHRRAPARSRWRSPTSMRERRW